MHKHRRSSEHATCTTSSYKCNRRYSKVEELQPSEEEEHAELKTPSNPATPCTPATPLHPQSPPNTPASHSHISDDTDKSTFSISMDSGLGSPDDFNMPQGQSGNYLSVRSLIGQNKPSSNTARASKAAEHTSKEKQRRERIKESCDQLRVLLPYIRGRKTDMASTLEMCVDYLHIVNTFMPQTLQDQIVDILSKDASLVPNRESLLRRKAKKEGKGSLDSPPGPKIMAAMNSPSAGIVVAGGVSEMEKKAANQTLLTLSTADIGQPDGKGPKRIRLQDLSDCAGENTHLDARLDPTVAGHNEVKLANYVYHQQQNGNMHHNGNGFQDMEEQNFPRLYSGPTIPDNSYAQTQQYFTFTTNNNNKNTAASPVDNDTLRPMYVDSTLYHYYPSVLPTTPSHTQPRLYSPSSEYVNPNTVLSGVPYSNVRIKPSEDVMKGEPGPRVTTG